MTHEMTEMETNDKVFGRNTEFHRFGLISAILLITGCLGGMAVGLGAVESTLATVVIVVPMMITLSLLLAVMPMKYIMISGVISAAIDLLFIAYYAFS